MRDEAVQVPDETRHVKDLPARVLALPPAEAFAEMAELSTRLFSSDEAQEGMRAFAERRAPSWVQEAS